VHGADHSRTRKADRRPRHRREQLRGGGAGRPEIEHVHAGRHHHHVAVLGIDENSYVVVVPAGVNVLDFGSAARTYWTLKYAGVGQVSILDGGLAAWKAV